MKNNNLIGNHFENSNFWLHYLGTEGHNFTWICWTRLNIITSPFRWPITSVNSLCSCASCWDDKPLLLVSSIWGTSFGYWAVHCTLRLSLAWICLLLKLLPCCGYTVSSRSSGCHVSLCSLLFWRSSPNIACKEVTNEVNTKKMFPLQFYKHKFETKIAMEYWLKGNQHLPVKY